MTNATASSRHPTADLSWDGPVLLNDRPTQDERLIRDTARACAEDRLQPRVLAPYAYEQTGNLYHLMRYAQKLEAVSSYEVPQDVHALILGSPETGIKALP